MLTRRQLLEQGAMGGAAGLVLGHASFALATPPAAVGATPRLRRWQEALPLPPVLDGRGGGKSFTIAARESTTWKFHPDLPASEQRRIFEKFHRLDPNQTRGVGGTGLGLYISDELVRLMHGQIWVTSEVGKGSSFAVELPRADLTF